MEPAGVMSPSAQLQPTGGHRCQILPGADDFSHVHDDDAASGDTQMTVATANQQQTRPATSCWTYALCLPKFTDWLKNKDETLSMEELYETAQPGDLMLFRGQGVDAAGIACLSRGGDNRWSHVEVIVGELVNPRTGIAEKYISGAYDKPIGVDYFVRREEDGTQTVPLWERLQRYGSKRFALRRLRTSERNRERFTQKFVEKTRQKIRDNGGKLHKYNLRNRPCFDVLGDWLEYWCMTDNDDNGGTYVCTQWVMDRLDAVGVVKLPEGAKPGNVSFAQLSGGLTGSMPAWGSYQPPHIQAGYQYEDRLWYVDYDKE